MTATTNRMELSHEWATRPDDQRFLTLDELAASVRNRKAESWTQAQDTSKLRVLPVDGRLQLDVGGRRPPVIPTHWAFGQLASYAKAPAGYLRTLAPELAAINLQYGLERNPVREEVLVLGRTNGDDTARSLTSTSYGRIWDADVVECVQRVNEDGRWVIPAASYATANPKRATTLYASDRDVFMFLCDPTRPIEIDGVPFFRGFIASNSEVGAGTMWLSGFLYEKVCDNRIIWGMRQEQSLRIVHTGGAPQRFISEGDRMLRQYSEESADHIVSGIRKAKAVEIAPPGPESKQTVTDWLKARGFTGAVAKASVDAAVAEEGQARTVWDIVQGITAHARSIVHTDVRVDLETKAGRLLAKVAD